MAQTPPQQRALLLCACVMSIWDGRANLPGPRTSPHGLNDRRAAGIGPYHNQAPVRSQSRRGFILNRSSSCEKWPFLHAARQTFMRLLRAAVLLILILSFMHVHAHVHVLKLYRPLGAELFNPKQDKLLQNEHFARWCNRSRGWWIPRPELCLAVVVCLQKSSPGKHLPHLMPLAFLVTLYPHQRGWPHWFST